MRIHFTSWRTTDDDVERSFEAMIRAARSASAPELRRECPASDDVRGEAQGENADASKQLRGMCGILSDLVIPVACL
jgi:hypothetical protein